MSTCPDCARRFRDAKAYAIYLKRKAVLAELRGGEPAAHLGPLARSIITYSGEPSKQERKRGNADAYRRVGA